MKENLPEKYNESLIFKLKNFFKNLFYRDDKKESIIKEKIINENKKTINSIEVLRENTQKDLEKNNLINKIIENPNLIESWSISELEKLDKICDEKNMQYDIEIASLI